MMKALILIFVISALESQAHASSTLLDYRDELSCAGELEVLTGSFGKTHLFHMIQTDQNGGLEDIVAISLYRAEGEDVGIFVLTTQGLNYFDLTPYKSRKENEPVLFLSMPGRVEPLHVLYAPGRVAINGFIYGDANSVTLAPSEASEADFDSSLVSAILDETDRAQRIYFSEKHSDNAVLARSLSGKTIVDLKNAFNKCKNISNPAIAEAISSAK